MGRISKQQIRVFGLFSAAFLMTGCAFVYNAMGQIPQAVVAILATVALMSQVFREAYHRTG